MTAFPSAAERGWFFGNYERTDADRLYGTGHRPAVEKVGAGWSTACGCADPRCTRADDDSRRIHRTWDAAWHAAATNLRDNEHGPSAGQESS